MGYLKENVMKRIRNVFALLLLVTLSAGILNGCGKKDTDQASADGKKTITIGYLPITHAVALFEAKELLDESEESVTISLQKFSSWTDLTNALNAGKIDGASMLIELAMSAKSQGIDLKAVSLGHKDGNVIVVSDDIESVEDLKGTTFAIPSNQSSHNILLQEALKEGGLTTDDITIVQLSPSEMPSSLASKAIDGYCVAEPFGAQAVSQDIGHVLYTSSELWEESICCALVLRSDYISENQADVNTLISYYTKGGSELDSTSELSLATDYLGQDESILEESLKWISFDDLTITEEAYDDLCTKVIEDKILDNPPSYSDFIYQTGK